MPPSTTSSSPFAVTPSPFADSIMENGQGQGILLLADSNTSIAHPFRVMQPRKGSLQVHPLSSFSHSPLSSSSPSSFLTPPTSSLPQLSPFKSLNPSPHPRGRSPSSFTVNTNTVNPYLRHRSSSTSSFSPILPPTHRRNHFQSPPSSPLSATFIEDRHSNDSASTTTTNPSLRRFDSTGSSCSTSTSTEEFHSTFGHTSGAGNTRPSSCATTTSSSSLSSSNSRHPLHPLHSCSTSYQNRDSHSFTPSSSPSSALPLPPRGSIPSANHHPVPSRPPRNRSNSHTLSTVFEQEQQQQHQPLNNPSYYSNWTPSPAEIAVINNMHHQHYHSSLKQQQQQQQQHESKPLTGLPRSMGSSVPSSSHPQYPSRNQSHQYQQQSQSLDSHHHHNNNNNNYASVHQQHQYFWPGPPPPPLPSQQEQQSNSNSYSKPKIPLGMSEEEFEEMEDRRRMQQQILRDKLVQADSRKTPDPTMTVQMTTNTGFALGTFDMSESLAIVEDLLDYFGEDELAALDLDGDDRFNESQLIEAERCHLERESLVRHLYDSEEDYLRSLQEIQSCYQQPLLRNLQHPEAKKGLLGTGGSSGKPVATKEEIETLFGNLDQLVEFHEGIRTMLEARSKIWGPTQIMSDLLLQVIPRFKIYSRYFTNFHAALTVLDRISRTPQYKKFMEQCVADSPPGTASLHLMLAFPLKRLSTYRDLICAICRATQPDHPDYYNLMRAQEAVHMVAAELRQERIMAQDQLALWDVQSNMVGLPEPIMMSPQGTSRRLILRADLHKVDASLQLEPRTYYLLNDVLLYARFDPKKNVYQYKGMFELARSQVKNAEDNPTLPQLPNSIQLSNQGRKQMMKLRSREERDHWLETMRETIEIANKMAPLSDAPIRKDVLPLFSHPNSDTVSTNSANANGNSKAGSTHGNGSLLGNGSTHGNSSLYGSGGNTPRTFSDSRSVTSKSSNETSGSGSKPGTTRKANPADFYGSSFGADVAVNPNEDNYHNYRSSPLALSTAMSNNSSSSSVSTGITTGSKGSSNSGKQSLGAMLAAIPVEQLTPKQAKAKAALAAAVEARRQERLKRELKSGASSSVKSEMNKNVNFDFSSSFIPAKERIAKT